VKFRKVDVFFVAGIEETCIDATLVELGEGSGIGCCQCKNEYQSSESVHDNGI
jgi:hypothetical protein